jgi:uncharacterized membrane protein YgcG
MIIRAILVLLALIPAMPLVPSKAAAVRVLDDARFFKPAAIRQADEQIADIHTRYQKDVFVETVATPPADRAPELKTLGRERFFAAWAEERMLASRVDGVYILICKDPSHVEVIISQDAGEPFNDRFRESLRRTLVRRFDRRQYDKGLLEGVALVREQLDQALAEPRRSNWLGIVWVIIGILGLWGVVVLLRRMMGPSGSPELKPIPAPTGGVSTWRHEAPTQEYPGPAPHEVSDAPK